MSVSIYCPYCHRYTALSVAPTEYTDSYGDKLKTGCVWEAGYEKYWWMGLCNYCNTPVLVYKNGETIFPEPLPKPSDSRIPKGLKKDLDEAKYCFSIKAYRACAVMARRSLQCACIDKGAKKDKLVHQIDELFANGKITSDIKDWAHVVRWVGNDAAHPNTNDVQEEEAKDILELAEQFLHVLYVAPAIAAERKKKMGK